MPSFNIGPDKEAFLRFLDDFNAVADPDALFDELLSCDDLLPVRQVESLGLPFGSTYRDAVRLLLGCWTSAE